MRRCEPTLDRAIKDLPVPLKEEYEERAAIREYLGKLPRYLAEVLAAQDLAAMPAYQRYKAVTGKGIPLKFLLDLPREAGQQQGALYSGTRPKSGGAP